MERADSAVSGRAATQGRHDGRAAARKDTRLLRIYGGGFLLGVVVGALTPKDFTARRCGPRARGCGRHVTVAGPATAVNEADRKFAVADSESLAAHPQAYRFAYEDGYRREYIGRRRLHAVLATLVGVLAATAVAGAIR